MFEHLTPLEAYRLKIALIVLVGIWGVMVWRVLFGLWRGK